MSSLKVRTAIVSVLLVLTAGCSIPHHVAADYPQYLANNVGASHLPQVKAGDQYYLPPETQNHSYEYRSALAGYAKVWIFEFGKVLDATMQSTDVVEAFGSITKANDRTHAGGNTIVFELQRYDFEEHGAHVGLVISVVGADGEIFKKSYHADGESQGGKMFWAGAFGMKNAMQQSTKLALDSILNEFIGDFKASEAARAAAGR